jgi:anti-sigma B factor antagonist
MAENVTNLNEAELRRTGFSAVADTSDRATVLKLEGELDVATAPALEEAVALAFAGQPSSLVIDLSSLTFLDSTGIRVLVTAGRRAEEAGCSLVLLAPTAQVLRVLRLTGVDRLLAIEL